MAPFEIAGQYLTVLKMYDLENHFELLKTFLYSVPLYIYHVFNCLLPKSNWFVRDSKIAKYFLTWIIFQARAKKWLAVFKFSTSSTTPRSVLSFFVFSTYQSSLREFSWFLVVDAFSSKWQWKSLTGWLLKYKDLYFCNIPPSYNIYELYRDISI